MTSASAEVDGWRVNMANEEMSISSILASIARGEGSTFFTLNLDHLVKLRSDSRFREAYRQATFVSADGAPIVYIGRRTWKDLQLTAGSDLMLPLTKAAADAGHSIFLFGSSTEVLTATEKVLSDASGGRLVIAGSIAPPRNFDVESALADQYIEDIRKSGAKICFVLLGAPKQELFAARAQRQGLKCCFVCVGAAADFLSGRATRAPKGFRRFGVEWLWRLMSEPRRLAPRYAKCAKLLAEIEWESWRNRRRSAANEEAGT